MSGRVDAMTLSNVARLEQYQTAAIISCIEIDAKMGIKCEVYAACARALAARVVGYLTFSTISVIGYKKNAACLAFGSLFSHFFCGLGGGFNRTQAENAVPK